MYVHKCVISIAHQKWNTCDKIQHYIHDFKQIQPEHWKYACILFVSLGVPQNPDQKKINITYHMNIYIFPGKLHLHSSRWTSMM